jgi:hypothetical protein
MPATLQPWVLEHQKFRINNESPFNFHSIWICYLPFMKENYNAWRINNSLFFMWSRKKNTSHHSNKQSLNCSYANNWCLKWKEKSEMHTLKTIMKSLIKNTPHLCITKNIPRYSSWPRTNLKMCFLRFFSESSTF